MTTSRAPGSPSAVRPKAAAKGAPERRGGSPRLEAGLAALRFTGSSTDAAGRSADAGPAVAIGYLRNLGGQSKARLSGAADRLTEAGTSMGFLVAGVYRDEASGDGSGFRAVLAHLRAVEDPVLILPSAAHLSRDPEERRWMRQMLDAIGVQLVVAPDPAGTGQDTKTPGSTPSASDCGGAT